MLPEVLISVTKELLIVAFVWMEPLHFWRLKLRIGRIWLWESGIVKPSFCPMWFEEACFHHIDLIAFVPNLVVILVSLLSYILFRRFSKVPRSVVKLVWRQSLGRLIA